MRGTVEGEGDGELVLHIYGKRRCEILFGMFLAKKLWLVFLGEDQLYQGLFGVSKASCSYDK